MKNELKSVEFGSAVAAMGFTEAVVVAVPVDGAALGLGVGLAVCVVQPATNTAVRTAAAINKTLTCFFTEKNLLFDHIVKKYKIFHLNA